MTPQPPLPAHALPSLYAPQPPPPPGANQALVVYPHNLSTLEQVWYGAPLVIGVVKSEVERESRRPVDWALLARNLLLLAAAFPLLGIICTGGATIALLTGGACLAPLFGGMISMMFRHRATPPPKRAYVYVVDAGGVSQNVELHAPLRGAHVLQGQKVAFWGMRDPATQSLIAARAHIFEDHGQPTSMYASGHGLTNWRVTVVVLVAVVAFYVWLFSLVLSNGGS